MTDSTRHQHSEPRTNVLLSALSELAGPAIVLDSELRIVDHTPGAEQLVGTPVPTGVAAPKLLCGMGSERPLAEALAEGRAVTAHVERVGAGGGTTLLTVRATPLDKNGEHSGWLLVLGRDRNEDDPDAPIEIGGMLTRDAGMKGLLHDARRAAASDAPAQVHGEIGSGRRLLARFIHDQSTREQGPFCTVRCAGLPASLLESELFGRSGAEGQIRQAHGGTLFLADVGELPVELQGRLLAVLETGRLVFTADPAEVDVRVVTATHRNLAEQTERGRFLGDLLYRLRVIPLFVPPLRDRPGDIQPLAERFVAEHNQVSGRQVARIAPGALTALCSYTWPGNIRELENAIRYAFVLGEGPVLTEGDLPPEVRGQASGQPLPANVPPGAPEQLPNEARRILRALERTGGNRERAAASLGMSRVTLWRKLKAFELEDAVRAGRRGQQR